MLLPGIVTRRIVPVAPTQVKAPLMTFVPTKLPLSAQVLVPVTVPFRLK